MMQVLLPRIDEQQWLRHVSEMVERRSLPVFSSVVLDFLQEISMVILKDSRMRQFSELMAAAHWFRRSNVTQMKNSFETRFKDKLLLARGVILHFAPANVDSIFFYSWMLSLLMGNANIIRLSQDRTEQTDVLLRIIEDLLDQEKYNLIRERTFVCSYNHDSDISKVLSGLSNVRVIWGGDETIQTIRSIPLPPRATELVFADRFSLAVLSSEAILELSEREFEGLIHRFYNDAFWFQQMACSSPRMVCWIGDKMTTEEAKQRFWHSLTEKLQQEQIQYPPSVHMNRLTAAFLYGANSTVKSISNTDFNIPLRIEIEKLGDDFRQMHCGGGMFLETRLLNLVELAELVSDKDQTLAHFGFTKDQLIELVQNIPGRGIDRIVPVGQALNFNEVWDGYHLLTYFTREVELI